MSRLDSHIRRLLAQRACLDPPIEAIASMNGPVVELGLGNGRAFGHLREQPPGREIIVFERQPAADADSTPNDSRPIIGDFRETLPNTSPPVSGPAAAAHGDVRSGDPTVDGDFARWLATTPPANAGPGRDHLHRRCG
ncbi:MAG: class I SAM-dependent methyltransferase [Pseudomonadota bacterium]